MLRKCISSLLHHSFGPLLLFNGLAGAAVAHAGNSIGLLYAHPAIVAQVGTVGSASTPDKVELSIDGVDIPLPFLGDENFVTFSIAPALPAGFSLNAHTGTISAVSAPVAVLKATKYTTTVAVFGNKTKATATVTITVDAVAPSNLTYHVNPAVFTKGVAIAPDSPASSGGAVVSYAVSPALPAGLALNTTSGVISGTPTAVTAKASYTVTATNSGGSTSDSLAITVDDVAPNLTYSSNPAVYTKGLAITPDSPVNTGGAVVSYAVSRALPAGLALNATTGVISGTTTAVTAAASYTVTAANSGGSTPVSLAITVNDQPPGSLSYASPTLSTVQGTPATDAPTVAGGGAVTTWSATTTQGPLPAWLTLDGSGNLTVTADAPVTSSLAVTVTAGDSGGSVSATVIIQVTPAGLPTLAINALPTYLYPGQTLTASINGQAAPGETFTWTTSNGAITLQGTSATVTAAVPGSLTLTCVGGNGTLTSNTAAVSATVLPTPQAEIFAQPRVHPGDVFSATLPAPFVVDWSLSLLNSPFSSTLDSLQVTAGPVGALTFQAGLTDVAGTAAVPGNASVNVVQGDFANPGGVTGNQGFATAVTLYTGRVLVVGDTQAAGIFDPVSNTWKRAAAPPVYGMAHTETLLGDGTVLVAGGYSTAIYGRPSAAIYDPASDSWTATQSMNTGRWGHAATLLNSGMVLVVGGQDGDGYQLWSPELYNPGARAWTALKSLAAQPATAFPTATLMADGRVLIAGGFDNVGNGIGSTAIYNPNLAQPTMTSAGSFGPARGGHSATLLPDGSVLVAGGTSSQYGPVSTTLTERYVPTGPQTGWHTAAPLNQARDSHGAAAFGAGVLVMGGEDVTGAINNNISYPTTSEYYNPGQGPGNQDSWTVTGNLQLPRTQPYTVALPDGRVLVGAGFSNYFIDFLANGSNLNDMSSAEIYSGSTSAGTWISPWTGTSTARYGHTATLLNDGTVLMAGGVDETQAATTSAQRYDPVAQTWTTVNPLNNARSAHTATLLPDGTVLVAGGGNAIPPFGTVQSSELFSPNGASGSWGPAIGMVAPRVGHSANVITDRGLQVVMAAGGLDANGNAQASIEFFNESGPYWEAISFASMTQARAFHTATTLQDGSVLVAGGSYSSDALASAEWYDPSQETWTSVAPLNQTRSSHTASLLYDGTVLVVGGFSSSIGGYVGTPASVTGTTEIYKAGTWTYAAPLLQARADHTATVINNGTQVLVTGGVDGNGNPIAEAEVYDYASNSWNNAGNLPGGIMGLDSARYLHTATLLQDGQTVLVFGGFYPQANLEIWK